MINIYPRFINVSKSSYYEHVVLWVFYHALIACYNICSFANYNCFITHVSLLLWTVKLGIGGFSMGAATALYSATCRITGQYGNGNLYPVDLSVVIGLSGWLPCSRFRFHHIHMWHKTPMHKFINIQNQTQVAYALFCWNAINLSHRNCVLGPWGTGWRGHMRLRGMQHLCPFCYAMV